MRGRLTTTTLTIAALAALTACGDQDPPAAGGDPAAAVTPTPDDRDDDLEVPLVDATGAQVGTVTLDEEDGLLEVDVAVDGLEPGFHGFHVHAVGLCEPASPDPSDPAKIGDFLSAGGHLGADAGDHGEHAGDLPPLLVDESGSAELTVTTDALTLADLTDDDGSAVMVHAGRDNLANVPERYAPDGPDETTRKTGDAGDRVACGVVGG